MSLPDYRIRTATQNDIDLAVEWAAAEGWNPGLYDAEAFFAADAEAFLFGFLDEEPVACISALRYASQFAFLGFYIVKPAFRGKGYGLRIWEAAIARTKGLVVGLDGVVDQQPNYAKSGFALAYRNIRQEGFGDGEAGAADPSIPLSEIPFDQIAAYDRRFFPERRESFLRAWLAYPGSVALGLRDGDALAGMGVLRPCRRGYKIGPLYADTPAHAEKLFRALRARVPKDEPFYLDTPEINREAVALAGRFGLLPVFETARMYKGSPPQLDLAGMFGVTTFELG